MDVGKPMQREITDDLDALLEALPPHVSQPLRQLSDRGNLLEVVLDLGRLPEARFRDRELVLSEHEVSDADIEHVVARIGVFGQDNRAGIERTLHRISAIRNRSGRIVGLTCRVGRAVYGTINIIRDIVESGRSILLLGRPGVGKTTMLREVARVLADDLHKRVVIVDTSNEIAGDGDIPHPAIGRARRMQVPTPSLQHNVMIEAVENHMPEAIIIDEIGTELEAGASRTIAERGVQLIATAHGITLENLILNPTLSDLLGGIQTVTLGDEEARRRGTQKSVLERKAPPTFTVLVEIQSWDDVAVHQDLASVVDATLRGQFVSPEHRRAREDGGVEMLTGEESRTGGFASGSQLANGEAGEQTVFGRLDTSPSRPLTVYVYGVGQERLEQAVRTLHLPVTATKNLQSADMLVTLRNLFRKRTPLIRTAQAAGMPIYVLRNNTVSQMTQCLASIYHLNGNGTDAASNGADDGLKEAEEAITEVLQGAQPVELTPRNSYVRRLQHQLAEKWHLGSRSMGRDPNRRVKIFRN